MPSLRLLLVDSGVGGLSVLKELSKALPQAEIIYLADTAAFPHSDQNEAALVDRLKALISGVVETGHPDMVVVTGSTASCLALEDLQDHFSFPLIGCCPALERGVEMTGRACVGLLETELTLGLRGCRKWVDRAAASCKVVRVGTSRLAALAERRFRGLPIDQAILAQETGACFLMRKRRPPIRWFWALHITGFFSRNCAVWGLQEPCGSSRAWKWPNVFLTRQARLRCRQADGH